MDIKTFLIEHIGTIGSGLVGFFGGWFWLKGQNRKLNHDALNKLRDDLFKQISLQDMRIADVEKKLEMWKTRYWKLYAAHVKLLADHNLDLPIEFLELKEEE